MKRWYVAQTQQRAEERARINLERQGFYTYLPCYRREVRHARRRDIVRAPLFPGYIFIQLEPERTPWRSVNGTFGVNHLVCRGPLPAAVPEGIVEKLVDRENEDGLIEVQLPRFEKGAPLRIVSGALADCPGLFETMTDRDRVVLLLDLLGRKVRVEAPQNAVVADN